MSAPPLTELAAGGEQRFSDAAIAQVQAHPDFGAAIRRGITGTLEQCRADRRILRLNRDVGHFLMAVFSSYVHHSGGLSLKRLQQVCAEAELCSPDRAIALLIQLRLMSFVTPLPKRGDGRVRWYAPTPGMASALRARMRNDLAAAVMIDPSGVPALERFDEPEIYERFIATFGEGVVTSYRITQSLPPRNPSLEMVSRRAAGLATLFLMMAGADPADETPPVGPFPVSVRAISREFQVSRSQALRVLQECEELGYLTRSADGNEGHMTEALRGELKLYFAVLFLGLTWCARAAVEAVGEAPAELRA